MKKGKGKEFRRPSTVTIITPDYKLPPRKYVVMNFFPKKSLTVLLSRSNPKKKQKACVEKKISLKVLRKMIDEGKACCEYRH